jgi:Glycosyl hydrolase family 26
LSSEHRLRGGANRRRWQLVVVVGVFVAIAAVVGAVLTVLHHENTQAAGLGGPTPGTVPPAGGSQPGVGPLPPAEGAYLGAYVQPETGYTPQGRIDAVTAFEKAAGRQLDVVQTYHPWNDEFPDTTDKWAVNSSRKLLLSWAGTDTRTIQTGRYDGLIRQRARAVKALGKPIFLRWRWEMDRPNLQASIWTPQDYIAAWRHIRTIFAEEKVTNVSWVWCPTAAGFADSNRAAAYYPGDSDVDWLCADVYPGVHLENTFGSAAAGFLTWAKGHSDKPIMIAEWAASDQFPGGQTAWLDQAEKTAQDNPSIKALVYFDSNNASGEPQKELKLSGDAVSRFGDLLADPYFNTRRLPLGR